jgi:peroxiredoxin Q/BCP
MADGETSRLSPPLEAPDFTATTVEGEEVSLSQYRGTPVWLAFFRYAMCPLCNFRIHQLLQVWPQQFEGRGFQMLGVFQSTQRKLDGLMERHNPPFKVISDPKMELYGKYRVETSWKGMMSKDVRESMAGAAKAGIPLMRPWEGPPNRVPADFLIDTEGLVRTVFYGENMAQHIPFEDVESFLREVGY